MKKGVVLAGLVSLMLVAGCAVKYAHPTRAEERWNTDYELCVVEADYQVEFHGYQTDAAHPYDSRLLTYSPRYKGLIRTCMEKKGYTYEDDLKKILFDEES